MNREIFKTVDNMYVCVCVCVYIYIYIKENIKLNKISSTFYFILSSSIKQRGRQAFLFCPHLAIQIESLHLFSQYC